MFFHSCYIIIYPKVSHIPPLLSHSINLGDPWHLQWKKCILVCWYFISFTNLNAHEHATVNFRSLKNVRGKKLRKKWNSIGKIMQQRCLKFTWIFYLICQMHHQGFEINFQGCWNLQSISKDARKNLDGLKCQRSIFVRYSEFMILDVKDEFHLLESSNSYMKLGAWLN